MSGQHKGEEGLQHLEFHKFKWLWIYKVWGLAANRIRRAMVVILLTPCIEDTIMRWDISFWSGKKCLLIISPLSLCRSSLSRFVHMISCHVFLFSYTDSCQSVDLSHRPIKISARSALINLQTTAGIRVSAWCFLAPGGGNVQMKLSLAHRLETYKNWAPSPPTTSTTIAHLSGSGIKALAWFV